MEKTSRADEKPASSTQLYECKYCKENFFPQLVHDLHIMSKHATEWASTPCYVTSDTFSLDKNDLLKIARGEFGSLSSVTLNELQERGNVKVSTIRKQEVAPDKAENATNDGKKATVALNDLQERGTAKVSTIQNQEVAPDKVENANNDEKKKTNDDIPNRIEDKKANDDIPNRKRPRIEIDNGSNDENKNSNDNSEWKRPRIEEAIVDKATDIKPKPPPLVKPTFKKPRPAETEKNLRRVKAYLSRSLRSSRRDRIALTGGQYYRAKDGDGPNRRDNNNHDHQSSNDGSNEVIYAFRCFPNGQNGVKSQGSVYLIQPADGIDFLRNLTLKTTKARRQEQSTNNGTATGQTVRTNYEQSGHRFSTRRRSAGITERNRNYRDSDDDRQYPTNAESYRSSSYSRRRQGRHIYDTRINELQAGNDADCEIKNCLHLYLFESPAGDKAKSVNESSLLVLNWNRCHEFLAKCGHAVRTMIRIWIWVLNQNMDRMWAVDQDMDRMWAVDQDMDRMWAVDQNMDRMWAVDQELEYGLDVGSGPEYGSDIGIGYPKYGFTVYVSVSGTHRLVNTSPLIILLNRSSYSVPNSHVQSPEIINSNLSLLPGLGILILFSHRHTAFLCILSFSLRSSFLQSVESAYFSSHDLNMPQNIRDSAMDFTRLGHGGGCEENGGGCPSTNHGLTSNTMALERLRTVINVPPASRAPEWTNPLEKIEQLLTCAICLDRYKNPKLLPCQHSFCMEPCLDGLIDIVRRSVRCPECRAEHPLPYEGIKALQTNYTLMGFLEIHLQATEENASELESYIRRYNLERCKVCDEKGEVDYCPHCDKRVCLECKSTHVDMIKRDLGRLMNQVRRLCNRITDTAETLSRAVESISVNCENVKEEIRDYVKRYVKELKKREDTLISEVDAFYSAETRMVKTVRDNLELESSNINEACARVEACLKGEREMSDETLVKYKQMFTDGLEYLRTVNPDADELTNKKLRFGVNDAHLLPHAITQFGELQICTPQYSHKLAQADQIYVPRFLQLGLESDNYVSKRKFWDPSDSSTWQQQQQQQSQQHKHQPDEDAYSSRYKRRQLLEEQAWNRIRGERPQTQQQQSQQQRLSPKRSQEEGSSSRSVNQFDNSPWSRVRMNDQQPIIDNNINSTPTAQIVAQSESSSAAALPPLPPSNPTRRPHSSPQRTPVKKLEQKSSPSTSSTETHIPRLVPRPVRSTSNGIIANGNTKNPNEEKASTTVTGEKTATVGEKSPSEEKELDQRVDNIRKEYEQRQQEQERTILQIQQKVRAHRMPVDVASAPTASSEEEEEEEEDRNEGEPIPVRVYPKPTPPPEIVQQPNARAELRVVTNEPVMQPVAQQRKMSYPPFAPQQQSNGTIDWKKYLIPSPPGETARRQSATASSSRVNDLIRSRDPSPSSRIGESSTSTATPRIGESPSSRIGESSSSTVRPRIGECRGSSSEDSSWSERRKRFVRSKTNPDFSTDVSPITMESTRTSRRSMDTERRRFGATTITENHVTGNNSKGSSAAKTRYRRKAKRSRTDHLHNGEHNEGHDPHRFEISIGGNAEANTPNSAGPGMRFYRVFTNPKIDYLSKGRCLVKFGSKGTINGQFNWPRGVAIVPTTEEIVVCDSSNHRLQIFDKRGRFVKTFGAYGTGRSEFDCLAGISINKYRQFVVTDRYNHRVQIFDSSGRHLREFGAHGQTNGRFSSPWGVAVDQQGYIYVCDKDNHRVQIFQADGNFVGKFGSIGNRQGQFQNPHFVACNRQNQLIVSDSSNHRVQVFDHNGHFLFQFGSEGFHDGQFKYPRGVAVDEQGFIVVADSGNNRIQIFYPDGRFYSSFGTWGSADGQLKGVEGVAITADGKIIVADRENHRIQLF